MPLDYQQVRRQIQTLAEKAPQREKDLRDLRATAEKLLASNAADLDNLRDKVKRAANLNRNLRCAVPTNEGLTDTFPLPVLPTEATLIAADGSQINLTRHASVEYCVVNVGAIQMRYGTQEAPIPIIKTKLFYDEELYTEKGRLTEETIGQIRDQGEREILADLAEKAEAPIITFTDGQIELWGRGTSIESSPIFKKHLDTLSRLENVDAITAGYVDRPDSTLVVYLLELAVLDNLAEAGKNHWLRRIKDIELFRKILDPGCRSAIFGIQSKAAGYYKEELAPHFFYLNVSLKENDPSLARVEIPAWVANNSTMINNLHAILIEQCRVFENNPHPYLLQRAHETAVVTFDERNQVETMIQVELGKRGISSRGKSPKQFLKDLPKRARK